MNDILFMIQFTSYLFFTSPNLGTFVSLWLPLIVQSGTHKGTKADPKESEQDVENYDKAYIFDVRMIGELVWRVVCPKSWMPL